MYCRATPHSGNNGLTSEGERKAAWTGGCVKQGVVNCGVCGHRRGRLAMEDGVM